MGIGYSAVRRPEPRIAARIEAALGDAGSVLNVGAGTGSYEPADRAVTAVEPSREMIAQRPPGSAPVIQGFAEDLPLEDGSFDAVMALITVHHWSDVRAGLAEMVRVARQRVLVLTFTPVPAVSFDPAANDPARFCQVRTRSRTATSTSFVWCDSTSKPQKRYSIDHLNRMAT